METRSSLVSCLLLLSVQCVFSLTDGEKISALEKRLADLETTLIDLEPLFVARYGLILHCVTPTVQHGEAQCEGNLKPGTKCSVICNPGYIATPGKDVTSCQEDGFWTEELQCEIPLVLVSGGTVGQGDSGDSGLELLSFYPSSGCEQVIADMPLAEGSHRSLHNLVYVPPMRVLACNGMSSKNEATCDALDIANNTWAHHSYPNKGYLDSFCDLNSGMPHACSGNPDRKKGRYASEILTVGSKTIIVGGMVYDDTGHEPSDSVRKLGSMSWSSLSRSSSLLKRKRAFFCSVKVKEAGFLSVGGLGQAGKGNVVEQSVEYTNVNGMPGVSISKVSDMSIPRSGHGCTGVPGPDISVLVSGGTTGFGKNALAYAEIFNWQNNSWRNVAEMKTGRFGHAVVAVGEKIFAIGGDEKNLSNFLDTIEEYDVKKNAWEIIKTKLKMPRANFGYTLVPHSIFDGCIVSRPLDE